MTAPSTRTGGRLRERQERLAAALDTSRTGTFRWDIRTNVLGVDRDDSDGWVR